jgi:hypothetical protein
MMQLPECPKNTEELDMLIYGLTNPDYDKTRAEIEKEMKEGIKILRERGESEDAIRLYQMTLTFDEEDEKTLEYMQRWGDNRRRAARRFRIHFMSPCDHCIGLYRQLLEESTQESIRMSRLDPATITSKILRGLKANEHFDRLGSYNFKDPISMGWILNPVSKETNRPLDTRLD